MSASRVIRLLSAASVSAVSLTALPAAWAGSVLTLQATGTGSILGSGLLITNNRAAASGIQPFAIEGSGTGAGAGGMLGNTSNTNSIAIGGTNTGTGFGGLFQLTGPNTAAEDSAIEAIDFGGSTTKKGRYGSAGIFQTDNVKNLSPTVSITTNGVNSNALQVVNTGFRDGNANFGGIAGFFELTSRKAQFGQAAVFAVHTGGQKTPGSNGRYGNAGMFVIDNTNNFDSALVGRTSSGKGFGTGVEGDDFSSDGGVAVAGLSSNGLSAQFQGGSGGAGTCSYDGGPGWTCPSDRRLKDHFEAVDLPALLARLDAMPVFHYRMRNANEPAAYIGPTAQDFKAAFGLGKNDTTINTANAQGVALAAAKGLYQKLKADEAKIAADHDEIAALKQVVAEQRAAVASLRAVVTDLSHRSPLRDARLTSR